jgi:hypothetical protein
MLKKSASGVLATLRTSTLSELASSLTTALLDGLFEHPQVLVLAPSVKFQRYSVYKPSFSAAS